MVIGFTFVMALFMYLRNAVMVYFAFQGTKKLHEDMIQSVLNAPVNLYFDLTPLGRILNTFSKDLNLLEVQMTYQLSIFIGIFFQVLSIAVVAMFAHKYMLFLIPLGFAMCFDAVHGALPSLKQTSSLQRITKSPVLCHVKESLSGNTLIRVHGRTKQFVEEMNRILNMHILATQINLGIQSKFSYAVDLIAIFIMTAIALACLILREEVGTIEEQERVSYDETNKTEVVEAVLLSMLLSYAL
jgi:ABC-type multidrug transport system fused ATPase/permease subunit